MKQMSYIELGNRVLREDNYSQRPKSDYKYSRISNNGLESMIDRCGQKRAIIPLEDASWPRMPMKEITKELRWSGLRTDQEMRFN